MLPCKSIASILPSGETATCHRGAFMHNDGLMLRDLAGPERPRRWRKNRRQPAERDCGACISPVFFVIAGEPVCGKIQDLDKGSPELDKEPASFLHLLCDAAQHRAGGSGRISGRAGPMPRDGISAPSPAETKCGEARALLVDGPRRPRRFPDSLQCLAQIAGAAKEIGRRAAGDGARFEARALGRLDHRFAIEHAFGGMHEWMGMKDGGKRGQLSRRLTGTRCSIPRESIFRFSQS